MQHGFRQGNIADLEKLRELAIISWSPYKDVLAAEHWDSLNTILSNRETYKGLLEQSYCLICETNAKEIIGMAYLVPKGNPTDIYQDDWSYIRFVSVDPDFSGEGIGKQLTGKCIAYAKENNEQIVALHTSEIMTRAIWLYEKLGFRVLRKIEPRLGKRYCLYLLELDMG